MPLRLHCDSMRRRISSGRWLFLMFSTSHCRSKAADPNQLPAKHVRALSRSVAHLLPSCSRAPCLPACMQSSHHGCRAVAGSASSPHPQPPTPTTSPTTPTHLHRGLHPFPCPCGDCLHGAGPPAVQPAQPKGLCQLGGAGRTLHILLVRQHQERRPVQVAVAWGQGQGGAWAAQQQARARASPGGAWPACHPECAALARLSMMYRPAAATAPRFHACMQPAKHFRTKLRGRPGGKPCIPGLCLRGPGRAQPTQRTVQRRLGLLQPPPVRRIHAEQQRVALPVVLAPDGPQARGAADVPAQQRRAQRLKVRQVQADCGRAGVTGGEVKAVVVVVTGWRVGCFQGGCGGVGVGCGVGGLCMGRCAGSADRVTGRCASCMYAQEAGPRRRRWQRSRKQDRGKQARSARCKAAGRPAPAGSRGAHPARLWAPPGRPPGQERPCRAFSGAQAAWSSLPCRDPQSAREAPPCGA